jgi:Flp pilus assembly protein TadG
MMRLCACWRRLGRDTRGSSAVEFALVAGMLVVALLNAVDIGYYAYVRMEVENAAEMGAQAALKTCDLTKLPATTACSGLATAVVTAIHTTSLGTAVALQAQSPSEGYYCLNASNALQLVGSLNAKPADCSAAGNPALQPGDYLQVAVSYAYSPLFPGVSVMSALGIGAITMNSWMRMG